MANRTTRVWCINSQCSSATVDVKLYQPSQRVSNGIKTYWHDLHGGIQTQNCGTRSWYSANVLRACSEYFVRRSPDAGSLTSIQGATKMCWSLFRRFPQCFRAQKGSYLYCSKIPQDKRYIGSKRKIISPYIIPLNNTTNKYSVSFMRLNVGPFVLLHYTYTYYLVKVVWNVVVLKKLICIVL